MSSRQRFATSFGILVLLFLVIKSFFHFPFVADDYWYLWNTAADRFEWATFGPYRSRLPLWCLATWKTFTSGLAVHENLVYTLGFAGNGLCLMVLAKRMRERMEGDARLPILFFVLTTIFAFFPNDHEVLFWLSCISYACGLPFLVWGWLTERVWLKVLCYTIAFNFGEMHILPCLALEFLPLLLPKTGGLDIWTALRVKEERGVIFKKIGIWLASVVIFLGVRKVIALQAGSYPHTFAHDLSLYPKQLQNMLSHFFVMSFYKTFWPPTLLYCFALVWAVVYGLKRRLVTVRWITHAVLFILLCGSLVFAMGYFAPRALYGASICVNALLVVFLERTLRSAKPWLRNTIVSMIGLAFIGQSLFVYQLKDQNYKIMEQKELALVEYLQTCKGDCSIDTQAVPKGLKRGWVMHADYVKPYVEWIAIRHKIDEPIRYR